MMQSEMPSARATIKLGAVPCDRRGPTVERPEFLPWVNRLGLMRR
jgi:hypothetical protein